MTEAPQVSSVTLENVRIVFRNFSGKPGRYNKEGERNFSALLPDDIAALMEADGWNVRWLKPRDEEDKPQAHIPVKINFRSRRPPKFVLVTSRGKTPLDEDTVGMLDWADIINVDLIVNPYVRPRDDGDGFTVTAYLKSIFVTIREDDLDIKYADVPDNALDSLTVNATPFRPDEMDGREENDDTPPWED